MSEPKWHPKFKYVWTRKQMQAWVDFNGAFALWSGKMWVMKYKLICPGRYDIWFEEKK